MQGFFSSDLMSSVSCPSISLKFSYMKLKKFLDGKRDCLGAAGAAGADGSCF